LKAIQAEIRRLRAIVGDRPAAIDPSQAALLTLFYGPREKSGDDRSSGVGHGWKAVWPILCAMEHPQEHIGDLAYWTQYSEEHPPDCGTKARISRLFWQWRRETDWFSVRLREWQIRTGFRRHDGGWLQ
jgi:hypothetical protein